MGALTEYPDEIRQRATTTAVEARRDPATRAGALARIGQQLGICSCKAKYTPGRVGAPRPTGRVCT
jgi:hypothetical protein